MINRAQFRKDFPEFSDEAAYPDSGVDFWLNLAGQLLNGARWGMSAADPWPDDVGAADAPRPTRYDVGSELFVAHNLVIEKRAADAAAKGNAPGESTGPTASKSVGTVSVSYDTSAAVDPSASHWNLTNYGTRYSFLARMAGAGPVQLIPGCGYGSGAWPGATQRPW